MGAGLDGGTTDGVHAPGAEDEDRAYGRTARWHDNATKDEEDEEDEDGGEGVAPAAADEVPHVRQSHNWDCGVACALMALRALRAQGAEGDLVQHMRRMCGTTSVWTIDLAHLLAPPGPLGAPRARPGPARRWPGPPAGDDG